MSSDDAPSVHQVPQGFGTLATSTYRFLGHIES
jgi:hypothetical protein